MESRTSAYRVGVGDAYGAFEKAGFFHPGGTGHFAISVLREPSCVDRGLHRRGHAGKMTVTPVRTGPLPAINFAFSADQGGIAYFHSLDVGDGIQGATCAVERYTRAEGTSAWLRLGKG